MNSLKEIGEIKKEAKEKRVAVERVVGERVSRSKRQRERGRRRSIWDDEDISHQH